MTALRKRAEAGADIIAKHYVSEWDGDEEDVYANMKTDIADAIEVHAKAFAERALAHSWRNFDLSETGKADVLAKYAEWHDTAIAEAIAAAEREEG
jgi:hypothetical protein